MICPHHHGVRVQETSILGLLVIHHIHQVDVSWFHINGFYLEIKEPNSEHLFDS
jgi:hypothetical protein